MSFGVLGVQCRRHLAIITSAVRPAFADTGRRERRTAPPILSPAPHAGSTNRVGRIRGIRQWTSARRAKWPRADLCFPGWVVRQRFRSRACVPGRGVRRVLPNGGNFAAARARLRRPRPSRCTGRCNHQRVACRSHVALRRGTGKDAGSIRSRENESVTSMANRRWRGRRHGTDPPHVHADTARIRALVPAVEPQCVTDRRAGRRRTGSSSNRGPECGRDQLGPGRNRLPFAQHAPSRRGSALSTPRRRKHSAGFRASGPAALRCGTLWRGLVLSRAARSRDFHSHGRWRRPSLHRATRTPRGTCCSSDGRDHWLAVGIGCAPDDSYPCRTGATGRRLGLHHRSRARRGRDRRSLLSARAASSAH